MLDMFASGSAAGAVTGWTAGAAAVGDRNEADLKLSCQVNVSQSHIVGWFIHRTTTVAAWHCPHKLLINVSVLRMHRFYK